MVGKHRCSITTIFALVIVFTSGCIAQLGQDQITQTPIATLISSRSKPFVAKETVTPSLRFTELMPSETATFSPSPFATMTDSERQTLVQKFLKTSEECRLPCLWDIVPGVTRWTDLDSRLQRNGAESVSVKLENNDVLHGPSGFDFQNQHVYYRFSFLEREGIVTKIHLESEGYANPEYFQQQWNDYSPKQIMSVYGKPSRVWLKTSAETMGDRHGYDLWLVYDDYDFIIQYVGFLEERGQKLHVCPRFNNGMDIMWLQIHIREREYLTPLESMGGLVSLEPQAGKKSIEDATGMSVDKFYELFNQNEAPACIDTPSEIWE